MTDVTHVEGTAYPSSTRVPPWFRVWLCCSVFVYFFSFLYFMFFYHVLVCSDFTYTAQMFGIYNKILN
jgi:hypothetical protein